MDKIIARVTVLVLKKIFFKNALTDKDLKYAIKIDYAQGVFNRGGYEIGFFRDPKFWGFDISIPKNPKNPFF